jgi:phage repressor protein C with HTH and peptisase S24 domain
MAPRYFQGELIYVHPRLRQCVGGDFVVLRMADALLVRRLASTDGERCVLVQYSPPLEVDVDLAGCELHLVLTLRDLFGA